MKKIVSLSLAVAMMLSLSSVALADGDSSKNANPAEPQGQIIEATSEKYEGLSLVPPIDVEKGVSIPNKVYNIAEKGPYEFSGVSEYQTLYTEYRFTGQDDYTITIYNEGEHDINVKCKTRFQTFSNNTVAPNSTNTFSLASVGADTEFYIRFAGSLMEFSGSVE